MDEETRVKKELVENILDMACETISEMKKGDIIEHHIMAELLETRYPSWEYRNRQTKLRDLLINRHSFYLVNSKNRGYILEKNGKEHEFGQKRIKGAVVQIERRTDEIVKISPEGKTRQQADELTTVKQTAGRFCERVKSEFRDMIRKTKKEEEKSKLVTPLTIYSSREKNKELQV